MQEHIMHTEHRLATIWCKHLFEIYIPNIFTLFLCVHYTYSVFSFFYSSSTPLHQIDAPHHLMCECEEKKFENFKLKLYLYNMETHVSQFQCYHIDIFAICNDNVTKMELRVTSGRITCFRERRRAKIKYPRA